MRDGHGPAIGVVGDAHARAAHAALLHDAVGPVAHELEAQAVLVDQRLQPPRAVALPATRRPSASSRQRLAARIEREAGRLNAIGGADRAAGGVALEALVAAVGQRHREQPAHGVVREPGLLAGGIGHGLQVAPAVVVVARGLARAVGEGDEQRALVPAQAVVAAVRIGHEDRQAAPVVAQLRVRPSGSVSRTEVALVAVGVDVDAAVGLGFRASGRPKSV